MSELRSLLLHLDASPTSTSRLELTREIAAIHAARVTALYVSAPTTLSLPLAMAQGPAEVLPMLQQLDIDYRDQAKARFDRAVSTDQPSMRWRELRAGPLAKGFAAHALYTDLMVLGQHDRADAMTVGVPSDFVESVLLASGKPALVLPFVGTCETFGREALIAWNGTRESAHAISAALPFLRHAQRIHLTIAEGGMPVGEQHAELEDLLRLHGVEAPVHRHTAVPSDAAGESILSLANDVAADLLVMGCYGHGRAREWVLGGASRTVLDSMTLPVLMAH